MKPGTKASKKLAAAAAIHGAAEDIAGRKIHRRKHLPARTGLSLSTIYDMIGKGVFPRPIKLGEKASGWLEVEIAEWERARVAARDAALEHA